MSRTVRPELEVSGLPRRLGRVLPYGLVLVANFVALLATLLLAGLVERSTFSLFMAAVALTAWYGGFVPGLLSALVAVVLTDLFLLPPPGILALGAEDIPRLGVFVLVALVAGWLGRSRRSVEERWRAASALYAQSEQRAEELAQRAAVAIEHPRLYEQAEAAAMLKERQRLARDLHDSVTQPLYSLVLLAEAARRHLAHDDPAGVEHHLQRVRETAQQALREMRLLVYEMRPLVLQDIGLAAALQQRLDAVERRAGIQAHLVIEGAIELPGPVAAELYGIAQEALNNALKHAASSVTTVRLIRNRWGVTLEIADNGCGFDAGAESSHGGIGLSSMGERSRALGAELAIESAPGQGTRVMVSLEVRGDRWSDGRWQSWRNGSTS